MEKRMFLGYCAATGMAMANVDLANGASCGDWGPGDEPKAHRLLIVDAHAHFYLKRFCASIQAR